MPLAAEIFDLMATFTTGGQHNPRSALGWGQAVDVRTRDHSDAEVDAFIAGARAAAYVVGNERTRLPGQAVWSRPHFYLQITRTRPPHTAANP
jgi:hypothetical protein